MNIRVNSKNKWGEDLGEGLAWDENSQRIAFVFGFIKGISKLNFS